MPSRQGHVHLKFFLTLDVPDMRMFTPPPDIFFHAQEGGDARELVCRWEAHKFRAHAGNPLPLAGILSVITEVDGAVAALR